MSNTNVTCCHYIEVGAVSIFIDFVIRFVSSCAVKRGVALTSSSFARASLSRKLFDPNCVHLRCTHRPIDHVTVRVS